MVSRMHLPAKLSRRLPLILFVCLMGAMFASQVQAAKQRLCIYDPAGLEGEAYRAGMDYRLEMAEHGADLDLKVYTNERVAVEDFRTDQCDAVMATGIRTRQFNDIAGSLDVLGAATIVRQNKVDVEASFDVVRRYIETMSSPKAAGLMVSGQYEVAGIFPLGAAYAFVRDRSITSLEAASGKRVAALDYDKSQAEVIRRIGATAVAADTMNFANMFNNGTVDVIIAPTMAYKPLELYRGLVGKGGVSRYPLAFLTYQLVIKSAKFPKGFGQQSRDYMVQNYDIVIASLRLADRGIPADKWIDVPPDSVQRNTALLKKIRMDLAEQGLYNKQGLKLIKKIRCAVASELAECADNSENW